MKSSGIVRRLDELGRIVLPKELRKTLGINKRDSLEIYTQDSMIILKKYEPACIFCDNTDDIVKYQERNICKKCAKELAALASGSDESGNPEQSAEPTNQDASDKKAE